jgi:chromosome segregation ATPase
MEALIRPEQGGEPSPSDSDREELRSALNRMMEASAAWKRERAQLAAACDQLRRQLHDSQQAVASAERDRSQIEVARDQLLQQLKDTQHNANGWESERAGLTAESNDLRRQIDDTEEAAALALERQITTAVDRIRNELTRENDNLREEIQRRSAEVSELADARDRLKAELNDATQMLADTDEAAAIALERQIATAVGQVRGELLAAQDKLKDDVHGLRAERDEALESLARIREEHERILAHQKDGAATQQQLASAVERVRKESASERDQLRQELDAAMQLCAQRGTELKQLESERDLANQLLAEAAEAQQKALAENGKAEEAAQKAIASAVQRARAEFEKELNQTKVLLAEAQDSCARALEDAKDFERKKSELLDERDRLRGQVEELTDVAAQREVERNRLKEECEWANQMLADANSDRSSDPYGSSDSVSTEEARIEKLMQELSTLIDDPTTELAVVIRKTVERAQLDFYLKGLRFSATGVGPTTH